MFETTEGTVLCQLGLTSMRIFVQHIIIRNYLMCSVCSYHANRNVMR